MSSALLSSDADQMLNTMFVIKDNIYCLKQIVLDKRNFRQVSVSSFQAFISFVAVLLSLRIEIEHGLKFY